VRILLNTQRRPGWTGVLLEISLAAGVGIGIVAIALFALVWANMMRPAVILSVEAGMLAAAIWLALRRRAAKPAAGSTARSSWIWMLRAAAVLALLFFAQDAAKSIGANPHGGWDAFSIWNVKAKFLAGGPDAWRNVTAPVAGGVLFGANHPGYPLLLPSAVASAWILQGETASATAAALSVLFAIATAGILCGAVAWLRGEAASLLALLLLLASEGFVAQAALQNADIPLSLYIVATTALLALAFDHGLQEATLLLAGLCCGLAAWTKNEGLPFFLLAFAAVAWKGGRRAAGYLASGALPTIALLAAFKILLVDGVEAIFPKTLGEAFAKMTDASRWIQIAGSFVQSIWQMGSPWTHPVLLAVILAITLGLAPRAQVRQQIWLAIPAGGLLAADFVVYLISTADLGWHMSTSNLRLIVQVWPALLLVAFLFIAPPALPESAAVAMPGRVNRRAERKRKQHRKTP